MSINAKIKICSFIVIYISLLASKTFELITMARLGELIHNYILN